MNIIKTRLLHWKKEWLSLIFWLFFPLLATLSIFLITDIVKEDVKVPIGIVIDENSKLTNELLKSINDTPLLRTYLLEEDQALNQLKKHKLDSVFIVSDEYEERIRKADRDDLIKSYISDMSIAYVPVSEMIISFVQEDVSRAKTVNVIKDLTFQYSDKQHFSYEEIIETSKKIQEEQSLINATFTFSHTSQKIEEQDITIIKVWSVWSIFAFLSTFLLFEWVIKENHSLVVTRFTFLYMSLKKYLFKNSLIYIVLLYLVDLFTATVFFLVLNESLSFKFLLSLLSYRILINTGAFLFSLLFRNRYMYYTNTFIITLFLTVFSGAIIPVDGLVTRFSLFKWINPLSNFLTGQLFNIWLLVFILLIAIWYTRKEKIDA